MQNPKGIGVLSGASVVLALLQSLCTAILTLNAVRVAIGLTALGASAIYAPLLQFHQDAIRIPMLVIAVAGSVINLAVLAWIWYLRSRPSAQWRRKELSEKQKSSERLQVAMAVLTLALVGLEMWAHPIVNHPKPAVQAVQSSAS